MAAYDELPKFARDFCNEYGCQAIQIYNKLCDFNGNHEKLQKFLDSAVITYIENG